MPCHRLQKAPNSGPLNKAKVRIGLRLGAKVWDKARSRARAKATRAKVWPRARLRLSLGLRVHGAKAAKGLRLWPEL